MSVVLAGGMLLDGGFLAYIIMILVYTCIGTFVVVGATWLLVAIPYYFLCMQSPRPAFAHHAVGAGFAVVITALMSGGDSGVWPYLAIIALLSSFAGIHCLLRNLNREPNTPDRDTIAPTS